MHGCQRGIIGKEEKGDADFLDRLLKKKREKRQQRGSSKVEHRFRRVEGRTLKIGSKVIGKDLSISIKWEVPIARAGKEGENLKKAEGKSCIRTGRPFGRREEGVSRDSRVEEVVGKGTQKVPSGEERRLRYESFGGETNSCTRDSHLCWSKKGGVCQQSKKKEQKGITPERSPWCS